MDKKNNMENKEAHFEKIYYFIVGIVALIFAYIFTVTFVTIPKDNVRFVDSAFGFLLGVLSSAVAYLVGGNPSLQKKTDIASDKTIIDAHTEL